MARILVLCPSHRDYRELVERSHGARHELFFHPYASADLEEMLAPGGRHGDLGAIDDEVERLTRRYRHRVDAVVSSDDYPGSTLASVVADRLGLPGTSPKANLLCQHKYHARELQCAARVAGTPEFQRIGNASELALGLPCFIKPVKSFFSIGAGAATDETSLASAVRAATLPRRFYEPFAKLFEGHTGLPFGERTVLAESLIEGMQATLEGFVFQGRVHTLGVVDSVMYPGTTVFERFEYPSTLDEAVLAKMESVAAGALHAVGFDHGLFNVELFYAPDRDSVHVIEINPRMASQFADLYEKVDGLNTYELLLELGLGRRPRLAKRRGAHAFAVSKVLRRFTDGRVVDVPRPETLCALSDRHPDLRLETLVSPGRWLSQELQDGKSFRYGLINLGAGTRDQARAMCEELERQLPFRFAEGEGTS